MAFIIGEDRNQISLLPNTLDDFVDEDNPVRAKNTQEKKDTYRKRSWIAEHPFGTIKRHFGYTYFLTRGLESVRTEASLICFVYNLKRLIRIKGVRELVDVFKAKMILGSILKHTFFGNTVRIPSMPLISVSC